MSILEQGFFFKANVIARHKKEVVRKFSYTIGSLKGLGDQTDWVLVGIYE
jgi:hypothetical protein